MEIGVSLDFVAAFSLVLMRLVGFFMFAPVFATFVVPVRVRAALIFVFSFIAINLVPLGDIPTEPLEFGGLLVKEFLVGFALALTVGIVFIAAQIAGTILDNLIGFSATALFDPATRQQASILSQFYYLIAILFFITLGGLEVMIGGIMKSFELLPLTAPPQIDLMSTQVVYAVGEMMTIGVQIAAPVMVAAVIANVTLGLIVRAFPQANIFAVGLPLQLVVGLTSVLFTLPAFLYFFSDQMDRTLNLMDGFIRAMATG